MAENTGIMKVEVVEKDLAAFTENQVQMIKIATPKEYVKKRKGKGGREFDYVETNYVITMLNSLFGFRWDFDVLWEVPFVDALKQGSVTVKGKLTVYDKAGKSLSKTQYGSQPIVFEKDKPREPEYLAMEVGDLYKAASSDCLKKCASLFGIALDVYSGEFSGDTSGYQTGPAKTWNSKPSGGWYSKPQTTESEDGHYRLSVKQQKMLFAIGFHFGAKEGEIKDLANALYHLNSTSVFPSKDAFDEFLGIIRSFPKKEDGGRDKFLAYLKSAQASEVENENNAEASRSEVEDAGSK